MYSEQWSPGLRQGDVVGPIPIPLLNATPGTVRADRAFVAGSQSDAIDKFLIDAPQAYAAILSHDCEFTEDKAPRIVLGRIQRLPGNYAAEMIERVRRSNDVRRVLGTDTEAKIDGVNSFLLDEIPGHLDGDWTANFASVFSYANADGMVAQLLAVKRAELVHEQRILFKTKLAWFDYRGSDDVPAEEKGPKAERIAQFAEAIGQRGVVSGAGGA